MRLKEIRTKKNYIQKDMADILNVKRNTYTMWELEQDIIPLKKVIELAKEMDCAIDYILETNEGTYQYNDSKNFDYDLYLKRIKEVRKENQYTLEKLASKLNTCASVISRYEAGKHFILTDYLIGYSKIFDVSCDYLLGKIDSKNPEKEKAYQTL